MAGQRSGSLKYRSASAHNVSPVWTMCVRFCPGATTCNVSWASARPTNRARPSTATASLERQVIVLLIERLRKVVERLCLRLGDSRLNGATSRPFGADRKSTRLNSSHSQISYAVFCLKKKKREAAISYLRYST